MQTYIYKEARQLCVQHTQTFPYTAAPRWMYVLSNYKPLELSFKRHIPELLMEFKFKTPRWKERFKARKRQE